MKKNNNIIFDSDDSNKNDYLYCWQELNQRPNRVSIYHSFDKEVVENLLSNFEKKEETITSEIYPSETYHLENRKHFTRIEDGIFLSYTIYDVKSEESFIGDIVFYYDNNSEEKITSFTSKFEELLNHNETESFNEDSLFSLTLDTNGFDLLPINYLNSDLEQIELYYNDNVLKKIKKLSKKINSNEKGISVIWGEKGTGKSTLCCELLRKIQKKKIYIPPTLLETALASSEFRNFLMNNKSLTLVIDDIESLTNDLYLKSNALTRNLIQMVDGIESDNYLVNFILIANVESIDDIDDSILECNNFIEEVEVDYLSVDKSNDLSKKLKKSKKYKKEQRLIDILKKNNHKRPETVVGYE